jgi:hypothetical protein
MIKHIYLSCGRRDASPLTDELAEWFATNQIMATVLCYGITPKQHEGFVVMLLPGEVPPLVLEKLKQDSDILDYVVYDATVPQ